MVAKYFCRSFDNRSPFKSEFIQQINAYSHKLILYVVADSENKLRVGKNTNSVWFLKNIKKIKKKNTKENDFLMFNCLIKNLGCIWSSENTKK